VVKGAEKFYQIPFHPRAFAHTILSVWNELSLLNVIHMPTMAKLKTSPAPITLYILGQFFFCNALLKILRSASVTTH
jgi:hypothetical protein